MRFLLETTPEEYATKRHPLVKALINEFRAIDPELTEALEKALPPKEPSLKFLMLRQLHAKTTAQYKAMTKQMVEDIGQVLDQGVHKSATHDDVRKALKSVGNSEMAMAEGAEPGGEPDDPDYDAETGEPIIDPGTGLSPSEQADEEAAGGDETNAPDEAEKSLSGKLTMAPAPWVGEVVQSVGDDLVKALQGDCVSPDNGSQMGPEKGLSWRALTSGISKLNEWAKSHGGLLQSNGYHSGNVTVKLPKSKVNNLRHLKKAFDLNGHLISEGEDSYLAVRMVDMVRKLKQSGS